MFLSNLNSIQNTIGDLKQIVDRNQGGNHELTQIVKQMELLVTEMEQKARKNKKNSGAETMPAPSITAAFPAST